MSEKRCPTESELVSFVDADLSPEQLERIERHLERCRGCAQQVIELTTLATDVAAALPVAQPLDVAAHVSSVMQRLDTPVAVPGWSRVWAWSGALAMAAAALLVFVQLRRPPSVGEEAGQLVARGGVAEDTLTRNVGVQLYAQQEPLRALGSGDRITTQTRLTAGLRNVGKEQAYLLLFAIDAQNAVHWIAPEFASAGSNPAALPIAPAPSERLLASAAAFDDLAVGAVRVVAVVSRGPLRVSDVESLPAAELGLESLKKRFGQADVRQFSLEAQP